MTAAPFYQVTVPRVHGILDRGVTLRDGTPLHRTTINTPSRGYYYANEQNGVYIFSAREERVGMKISYVDVSGRAADKFRVHHVGGEQRG